jgi:hypothetical protein
MKSFIRATSLTILTVIVSLLSFSHLAFADPTITPDLNGTYSYSFHSNVGGFSEIGTFNSDGKGVITASGKRFPGNADVSYACTYALVSSVGRLVLVNCGAQGQFYVAPGANAVQIQPVSFGEDIGGVGYKQ